MSNAPATTPATIRCELVQDGPLIAGRPIIGVEAGLADRMRRTFDGLDELGIATKLADLPWVDAQDEGCSPGQMWRAVVNVMDPDGVTEVHLQAEPAGDGVVVYLPVLDDDEAGAA